MPSGCKNVNKYESTFCTPRKYISCPTKVYFVAVSIYYTRRQVNVMLINQN